jgi:hypothetical protein
MTPTSVSTTCTASAANVHRFIRNFSLHQDRHTPECLQQQAAILSHICCDQAVQKAWLGCCRSMHWSSTMPARLADFGHMPVWRICCMAAVLALGSMPLHSGQG